jgi:hypothetical protein
VKLVRAALCADREAVDRAIDAARTTGELDHRGLEFVLEAGWDGARAYVLGDIVPGSPASRLIARGPVEADPARSILRFAAEGLAAAHAVGAFHGALEALLLHVGYAGDRVLVRDFGLAGLTSTGAPTAAGDVLALGVIARELGCELPPGLLARMLHDEPAARPTMIEIRDQLGGAHRSTLVPPVVPPPAPAPSPPPPRRHAMPPSAARCDRCGELTVHAYCPNCGAYVVHGPNPPRDIAQLMAALAATDPGAADELTPLPGPPPLPDDKP